MKTTVSPPKVKSGMTLTLIAEIKMYESKVKPFKKRNPLAVELWSQKFRQRKERSMVRETKPKHRFGYLKEFA